MKRLVLLLVVFFIFESFAFALDDKTVTTPPPFGEVHHIGWVVKDMDKTIEYWKKLGIDDFNVRKNRHAGPLSIYRGKKMIAEYHMAFAHIGSVLLEMFEPVSGESPYSEFMKNHGEGIQHIGFLIFSHEELLAQVERLQKLGVTIQEQGQWDTKEGTAYFYYMDASQIGGLFFELMYNPQDVKSRMEGKKYVSNNEYPLNEIIQYAMVVKDVDKAMDFYTKIGFVNRGIKRDNKGLLRRYKGEEEDLRMHSGWSKFGSVSLEILQPTKGRSVYKDYLKKYGEGFNHIGIRVDDMDKAVEIFRERGAEVTQDGAWGEKEVAGRFAYLDTDKIGGLTIELLWYKK